MSWGGNKTVSFAHSQLAQLAWAINSVDRSRPLREIEEHLCQIARQIDNISTRRDRELRAKRKALIKADLGYKDDPKLSRFAPRPPEFGQQRQIIRLSANDEPMVFEVKLVKTRANSR